MIEYFSSGGTDDAVWQKAILDVVAAGVGFCGWQGFLISASYFLFDIGGGFQGWGDPVTSKRR